MDNRQTDPNFLGHSNEEVLQERFFLLINPFRKLSLSFLKGNP